MKITCSICKRTRSDNHFAKSKYHRNNRNTTCKECHSVYQKEWRRRKQNEAPTKTPLRKFCRMCQTEKPVGEFNQSKTSADKKTTYCKKCATELTLRYREKNKANKAFRILLALRSRQRQALKGKLKADTALNLIGCDASFLATYVSNLFEGGMSWGNYGEWHIDHIKPCATFDLADPEQQKKCFHYTNLRPLWASENLSRPKDGSDTLEGAKPWANKKLTPMTDAVFVKTQDTNYGWAIMGKHARNLERRLRHAEALLFLCLPTHGKADDPLDKRIRAHLAAAKEETM
jgi:hypothetical protein